MANPEHLEILKQGVEKWHEWRYENPKIQADLTLAFLFKANLTSVNLNRGILIGSHIRGVHLIDTHHKRGRLNEL